MYAHVVVDAPSDPKIPFFTYRIPSGISKSIKIGQLAVVPFGKREIRGYIVGFKKDTEIKSPRDVISLVSAVQLIPTNYIKLLKWVSSYYHAPMIDILKLMLPTFSRKYLAELSLDPMLNNHQTLLIFPSKKHLEKYTEKISKDILNYHHDLGLLEKRRAWEQIYQGEVRTIAGLRASIFAPCPNLKEIHVFNEEDQAYFEERSPYYNLVTIANKLSEINAAKLQVHSQAPRVESYYQFKVETAKNKPKKTISVVSLTDELKSGNHSPISRSLRSQLNSTFQESGRALLFLNRLRESGQVYCYDCKFSSFSPFPPNVCTNCQSQRIRFSSLNLKSIAQIIEKIFPETQIELVAEGQREVLKRGQKGKVVLATNSVFYTQTEKFDLVCLISADTILNFPDYRSSERTFAVIIDLSELVENKGQLIIQTYNPESPAIKCALEGKYEEFYELELTERRKLAYPPFAVFAKITVTQKKKPVAEIKAQKLYNTFLSLNDDFPLLEISPPRPSQILRSNFSYNIILKARKRENFSRYFEKVPRDFKVEVEPAELF